MSALTYKQFKEEQARKEREVQMLRDILRKLADLEVKVDTLEKSTLTSTELEQVRTFLRERFINLGKHS